MEIQEFVDTYKSVIDSLIQRQEDLEDMLFNQILNPAKSAMDEYEKTGRKSDFMGKHAETLSAFNDKLRAIEGDDFDLAEQAFEDWDAMEDKPESDVYVAALVEKVTEQIDKLKKAFGAEQIEVKSETEGKTEVVADGETVAEAVETEGKAEDKTETENSKEEEPKEETSAEDSKEEDVIDTDSDDYKKELAEFEKSLGL